MVTRSRSCGFVLHCTFLFFSSSSPHFLLLPPLASPPYFLSLSLPFSLSYVLLFLSSLITSLLLLLFNHHTTLLLLLSIRFSLILRYSSLYLTKYYVPVSSYLPNSIITWKLGSVSAFSHSDQNWVMKNVYQC